MQRKIKHGTVYVLGKNNHYMQCAQDQSETILVPTKINFPAIVTQIACGDEHTIFLTGRKI